MGIQEGISVVLRYVPSGVRQGCVLKSTLLSMYFDAVIHMALEEHMSQGTGVMLLYPPGAKIMGNCGFSCKTLVSDLEYADHMALVAVSQEDMKAMLQSLDEKCQQMGLTISTSAQRQPRPWLFYDMGIQKNRSIQN